MSYLHRRVVNNNGKMTVLGYGCSNYSAQLEQSRNIKFHFKFTKKTVFFVIVRKMK